MDIEEHWLKMSEKEHALLGLQHCKDAYIKTNNPVHVWRGYCEYRAAKIEMPEWIQEYLDDCARNIACLSMKKNPEIDQKVSRTTICDAFNLKESFVTSFHKESKSISLCCSVYPYLLQGVSLEYATLHASNKFQIPKEIWKDSEKPEYEKGKTSTRFRYAWVESGHHFIDLFSKHKECSIDSNAYKAFKLCKNWDEIKHFFKNSPIS